jgi:hypothetical protein
MSICESIREESKCSVCGKAMSEHSPYELQECRKKMGRKFVRDVSKP